MHTSDISCAMQISLAPIGEGEEPKAVGGGGPRGANAHPVAEQLPPPQRQLSTMARALKGSAKVTAKDTPNPLLQLNVLPLVVDNPMLARVRALTLQPTKRTDKDNEDPTQANDTSDSQMKLRRRLQMVRRHSCTCMWCCGGPACASGVGPLCGVTFQFARPNIRLHAAHRLRRWGGERARQELRSSHGKQPEPRAIMQRTRVAGTLPCRSLVRLMTRVERWPIDSFLCGPFGWPCTSCRSTSSLCG